MYITFDEVMSFKREIDELKAELMESRKKCRMMVNKADELQADKGALYDHNTHLQAEISQLKADIKHDADVCYDVDDKHIKIIDELKAEIKEKEKQYHMLASSKSSHYPKEYRQEAEEYFSHNPNGEKLFFFMVGDSEVDEDGDIRKTLNVGVDAIAECDNFNGDISVEVFK